MENILKSINKQKKQSPPYGIQNNMDKEAGYQYKLKGKEKESFSLKNSQLQLISVQNWH